MVFLKCTLKSKKLSHSLFEFFRFFDYLSYFRWLYDDLPPISQTPV